MKKTADGMKPAYAVFVGGSELQSKEKLADMGLTLLAEKIPAFLVELGKTVAAENTTFEKWIPDHADEMTALILLRFFSSVFDCYAIIVLIFDDSDAL